jgi:hypothetical protein
MSLANPHHFAPGGVLWRVTDQGVGIAGEPPVGTPGEPETVRRVLGWFGAEINAASKAHGVPAALLVAIICNESAGDGETERASVTNSRREEPGYISDETTPSRVSIGCCQTLLSTARETLQRPDLTSADLENPATSLMAGAAYIASQRTLTGLDPVLVAAAYNAGGLHPEPTTTNRWGLRCYPIGTGAYIDRFVLWYNDACRVALES